MFRIVAILRFSVRCSIDTIISWVVFRKREKFSFSLDRRENVRAKYHRPDYELGPNLGLGILGLTGDQHASVPFRAVFRCL